MEETKMDTTETFKQMVNRCRELPKELREIELRKWLHQNPEAMKRALKAFQTIGEYKD